jgi:hypothetical protein
MGVARKRDWLSRAVLVQAASVIRFWNPIVVARAVASSVLAEPPITLDCTIGYCNF